MLNLGGRGAHPVPFIVITSSTCATAMPGTSSASVTSGGRPSLRTGFPARGVIRSVSSRWSAVRGLSRSVITKPSEGQTCIATSIFGHSPPISHEPLVRVATLMPASDFQSTI